VIIEWQKTGKPIDPANFFPFSRKTSVEIGFGKGDFIENYCKVYRDNLIGIEISEYSLRNAIKRLSKYNNIKILKSEAFFAIGHLFRKSTIDKIFIIFPDPWPKKRHYKKRFLNSEFFDRLAYVLKNRGKIFIITDEKVLAENINKILQKNQHFSLKKPPVKYIELAKNTKYGKKWRDYKKQFFIFYLVKVKGIKKYWDDILTGKRFDHILIEDFDLKKFIKKAKGVFIKDKSKFISFKNIYRGERNFILEFILKEETLLQNIFLKGEILEKKCVIKSLNPYNTIFTKGFFEIVNALSL